MARNILLTSPDNQYGERTLRYYASENEFGRKYCTAMQAMEASSKYILSCFPIDEIFVIGGEELSISADAGKSFRLRDAGALYDEDPETLSAFTLYRYRIGQYIDELKTEQEKYNAVLPEEERAKLADFISQYQEQHSKQEDKRLNRFFDELASSQEFYEQFIGAISPVLQETCKDSRLAMIWVKNYLYSQMKSSAKLAILPVNENVCVSYFPASMLVNREDWYANILNTDEETADGKDEINLYVSLASDSMLDNHLIQNILEILASTPGSSVHLKKYFRVLDLSGRLTGMIADTTAISRSTDLVSAAHALLNYSKTDMLVSFWEDSGERNERISRLIYAARHVDVGISMCNIMEVEAGLRQLRALLMDDRSWTETGRYGLLFGIIAGCIQADYGVLLENENDYVFFELIKWAFRHQLYQQVLTLIETYAPTCLVNSGIFYYCDDEAKTNDVINILAQQRLELKPYEYYKLDDIDHYFVKTYDRGSVRLSNSRGEDRNHVYAVLRAQSIESKDPGKISGYTACSSKETVQNVLYAYYHLGEVRNKISHADYTAMAEKRLIVSENDASYPLMIMRESIEYFIISFEKALEEVKGKNPKIVMITSDEVRKAAERISRERYSDGRRPGPRK